MKLKLLYILLDLAFFYLPASGQIPVRINDKSYIGIPAVGFVGGISGFKTNDYEIGLGINIMETRPLNKAFNKPFLGISMAANFNAHHKDLIGESLNLWFNGLIVMGLNQNWYSDGKFQTFGIKPFAGLEFYGISFIYGYNFFLNNNEINELTNHIFSIRYFVPVIRLRKNRY